MKIKYLASSTVIIESENSKILCDPWLTDGEYYGTWYHYPPLNVDWEEINSCDAIYVSHIHPDHLSEETFKYIDKKIPVYVLKFSTPYLRLKLQSLGFTVNELENGVKTFLTTNLWIEIYAADNCDPEKCFRYFGCGSLEDKYKNTSIDSLSLIGNDKYKICNINDCPYDIAKFALDNMLSKHSEIDLLLVGHAGANAYPHCFDLSKEEKIKAGIEKKKFNLDKGFNFLKKINPKYFIPFAGKYILGGRVHHLQNEIWMASQHEALQYYGMFFPGGFALNSNEKFDITTGECSANFIPDDPEQIREYQKTISNNEYIFDSDPIPTLDEFKPLVDKAFQRVNQKCQELRFQSSTKCYVSLNSATYAKIHFDEKRYEFVNFIDENESYVLFSTEPKLLMRILKGPKYAHWNNAEIGSLIRFKRKPNVYERGLHHIMNFFHS